MSIAGGAVDPVTELLSNKLMRSLYGETLSYYYDPFLEWYEDKLAAYEVDEPVPTPEPSTWAMLAAGLMAVVVMNRKQLV